MRTKTLGILGLFGAPWLYLGIQLEESYPNLGNSWFTGVWGLLYITGWLGVVFAFRKLHLAGEGRSGQILLSTLVVTLGLADISNLLQLFLPQQKPAWFFAIDLFWPISNVVMLAVGFAVASANVLSGWKKYVPLAAGAWLPLSLLSLRFSPEISMTFTGLYSAIVWTILSVILITHSVNDAPANNEVSNRLNGRIRLRSAGATTRGKGKFEFGVRVR